MTDVISLSKKAFTWSVVSLTILWSVGFAAFVPLVAHAEVCPTLEVGDLLKAQTGSAVYVLNADLEAAYFPHSSVYFTWFEDYSGIVTLSADCFDNYEAAKGVNYMPGTYLVTRVETPTVYAVLPGNMAAPIASEEVARALYGDNWTSLVRDVHTFHWINYTVTDGISSAVPHNGMLVSTADTDNVYWVEDGMYKMVDGDLGPWDAFVHEVSQDVFDTLSMSSETVTLASILEDPTQGAVNGSTGPTTPTTPVEAGELNFSLAASTPRGETVPGYAQGVEYLRFVVSGEGHLDSITLDRSGIGERNNFSKVYLYHGTTRVDNGRSLNSDDQVTFSVNMDIDGTETFTVRADMAGSANYEGDQNYFEIISANYIDTDADITGSFPIRGNIFEMGSQDIGSVSTTAYGTSSTAQMGEDEVQIGGFQLEAKNDDIWLSSVRLENRGTADNDALENIELRKGGTVVAEGEVDGDYVNFEFEDLLQIEEGDTETFKVYGDVGVSDVGDTFQLVLDEESDIEAYSEGFEGYLANVDNVHTSSPLNTTYALKVTLEGGKINVDFTGSNEDVRVDQQNVAFGVFEIQATSESLDVDQFDFVLHRPNSAPCLEDLRLRDKNGHGSYSLDATAACSTGTANVTYRVENILLNQGVTYEFEVIADVASNAVLDDKYYFTWAASAFVAEGDDSGNTVSSGDFSSASLTGPTMTVTPSSLVVRSRALSDDTVVNGTRDVLMFRGELEAGSTSAVTVTSITVAKNGGSDWDNLIDSLDLYVGHGTNLIDVLSGPTDYDSSVSGEEGVFTGLNIRVPAGSANKVDFEIYAQITDGSTTGTVDVAVTDVDATDDDSDTVTAKDTSGTAVSAANPVTTDRDITVAGTGSLTVVVDNSKSGLKKARWVLAGDDSALVGAVKLQATNEAVKLKDLVVFVSTTATTSTVESTFDSFSLYTDAALTNSVATADASKGNVTFEDVNFTVGNDDTEYLYIGAVVNSVGTGADGTATPSTTIRVRAEGTGTTAEGVSSRDDLTPTVTEATHSKDITVAATRIFAESNFTDTSLTAGVSKTLFSFQVTSDANGNTDTNGDALAAELQRIKLELSTDVGTSSSENVSNLQLCNLSTGTCLNLNTVGTLSDTTTTVQLQTGTDGYVNAASTTFTTDESNVIEDGETVTFTVKGTVSNVTDKFLQVVVTNMDNNGLSWGYDTDDNGSVDYVHTDLRKDEPVGVNYPSLVGSSLNN